jgi:hypothetical protein
MASQASEVVFDDAAVRVFCLSMQRTGTTSVGRFFRDFGYQWAGWPADLKNAWSISWYEGDFEAIFSSQDFRTANAFEDSPWFLPDFYKVLFNRFPNSRFVLFTRDADAWFESMVKHSNGDIVGLERNHSKIYRRELEFYELLRRGIVGDPGLEGLSLPKTMKLTGHEEHYKQLYRLHAIEVQDYFRRHAPDALFVGELEDPAKWVKLGAFLGVEVKADYESHENASA